jgi:hypothetical protein
VLSVLSVGFPNYETILCSHIYMTNPCYTERIKTVSEEMRTVEFCSKFAWISFIAFGEFLIHVNKFRDYKNSYLRSSLNTQQTCGGNLPKFPYTYICCSSMFFLILYPAIREYLFFCNVQGSSDISGTISKLYCCIKKKIFLIIFWRKTFSAVCRRVINNKHTYCGKD